MAELKSGGEGGWDEVILDRDSQRDAPAAINKPVSAIDAYQPFKSDDTAL